MENTFKIVVPAELSKGKDGDWVVTGLASTPNRDRQGEKIDINGIDATPITQGKGFFNFDHDNQPESTIGVLDSYKKSSNGMYVSGRLFKNHTKAKAVYEIMSSLNKNETGRVGMSVEGKVLERDSRDPSIIKRCIIKNIAITLNPVNQDTYADIVKSFSSPDSQVEFDSTGKREFPTPIPVVELPTFTATQVMEIVQKALGIGGGSYGNTPPGQLSGGAALQQEGSEKKKKKLKKMDKAMYKSLIIDMVDKLQKLYPDNSRTEILNAVQERLETRFPELK